jgi:hypothetical protein
MERIKCEVSESRGTLSSKGHEGHEFGGRLALLKGATNADERAVFRPRKSPLFTAGSLSRARG